jgi:glycerol-3-phosphate acyltransferase PlsX
MKIGIDIMGGDFAPSEAIKGAKVYLEEGNKAHLVLIGDEAQINSLLASNPIPGNNFSIVHASQVIEMDESPTKALKEKQKSSIAIGFYLLGAEKIDAFISAGNTGAMLVGSLYALKPIEGVLRPTISTIIPKENGKTGLLLDVGLNSDCKPDQLNQFAVMGSVYAQQILGIENPRVALINIGEEEGKGN